MNLKLSLLLLLALPAVHAEAPVAATEAQLAAGVAQLRQTVGNWCVTTEQLAPDGKVARSLQGSYRFDWVVPDRVVAGRSDIPELQQTAGILFYLRAKHAVIEMVSVGADGHLWVMSGPVDGETRMTAPTRLTDGSSMRLRFTRFNAEADRFESRMEYTMDDGASWTPGNHQEFVRCSGPGPL